jgi:hypothetical protein
VRAVRPHPQRTERAPEHTADLATLNAQIEQRLAAAVDRALNEFSASGAPGTPPNPA